MNNKPNQTECAMQPDNGRLQLQETAAGQSVNPVRQHARHTYFNTSVLLHNRPGSHTQDVIAASVCPRGR